MGQLVVGCFVVLVVFGPVWFILWLIGLIFDEFNPVDSEESSELVNNGHNDSNAAVGTKTAVIDQYSNGHFYTSAIVDGVTVEFMVDTGATQVALTLSDAKRLGFDPEELNFCERISTVNGETVAAEVLINSIRIGQVEIFNISALVVGSMSVPSLLGMNFLSELDSYEFRGPDLVIRQ